MKLSINHTIYFNFFRIIINGLVGIYKGLSKGFYNGIK